MNKQIFRIVNTIMIAMLGGIALLFTACDKEESVQKFHDPEGLGVDVEYVRGLETDKVALYIHKEVVLRFLEVDNRMDERTYEWLKENGLYNQAFYPMSLDMAKRIITENSDFGDKKDFSTDEEYIYAHTELKLIYDYVKKHSLEYKYVTKGWNDGGIVLFNMI